jgi:hypothetical protein
MNATQRWFGIPAALALVALAACAGVANAADPRARDEIVRSPRLDAHPARVVAILPAVTTVEDAAVERAVECAWAALYQGGRTTWMSADAVRARIERMCFDHAAFMAAIHERIWLDGEVDAATARLLARLLAVDAVLCIRVDRFGFADGCRAIVAMRAVMVGPDGERLWSIAGSAGRDTPRHPVDEMRCRSACLARATYDLFARWAWSLPTPMYEEPDRVAEPMLAGGAPR